MEQRALGHCPSEVTKLSVPNIFKRFYFSLNDPTVLTPDLDLNSTFSSHHVASPRSSQVRLKFRRSLAVGEPCQ